MDRGGSEHYSPRRNNESLRPKACRSARDEPHAGHPCQHARTSVLRKPLHGSTDSGSYSRAPAFRSKRTDAKPRPAPEMDSYQLQSPVTNSVSRGSSPVKRIRYRESVRSLARQPKTSSASETDPFVLHLINQPARLIQK